MMKAKFQKEIKWKWKNMGLYYNPHYYGDTMFPTKKEFRQVLEEELTYERMENFMNTDINQVTIQIHEFLQDVSHKLVYICGCCIDNEGMILYSSAIVTALIRLKCEKHHYIHNGTDQEKNVVISFIIKTGKNFLRGEKNE